MDSPETGGVVLFGAAGVGKTRLARHALEMAWARGMVTSSVRANRSASQIPFGALAPLFAQLGVGGEASAGLLGEVAQAVEAHRGDGRLVLVVDDAQELDDASGALLDHLLQTGRVFVVLTARLGERQAAAVHDMWKDERIVRVEVEPLSDGEVRTLASVALRGPIDSASLQTLTRTCAGNVLFLRELIMGALESGSLEKRQGVWHITGTIARSPRLRDLIEQRLQDVSDDEREALALVALGEPLELGLLSSLVGAKAVETLEGRGVLDSEAGARGPDVRFDHPLFGEVVRAHITPIQKARLSRSLADAAETLGGFGTDGGLRAAVWRLDGGGDAHPDLTVAAAQEAFGREDYVLSARLARSAWDASADYRAALLLTDSYALTGRITEIEDVLVAAEASAVDDEQRTELVVRRASTLFRLPDQAARAGEILARAIAQATDPALRRRLVVQQAQHYLLGGDVARCIALHDETPGAAIELALAPATRDYGVALALAGRTAAAIRHTADALACLNLEDAAHLVPAAGFVVGQALSLCEAGSLREAGGLASAAYVIASERGNSDGQAWFASILGLIRCTEGQLASAAVYFQEAASRFEGLGHPGRRWGLGGLALAHGQRGDAAASADAMAQLDAMAPTTMTMMDVGVRQGRAWSLVAQGNLVGGRDTLLDAVTLAESWGQLAGAAAALHDLLRLGQGPPAARRLLAMATEVDGELMAARLHLARAVAEDDIDQATQATDGFEATGALLFAAESAAVERHLATQRGLARRAVAAGTRSASLAERCDQPRTPGLTRQPGTEGLSLREREVALLAARGQTSRAIAERLFVSSRTVDNHLQRIYTKLGVSSRQQLRAVIDGAT
jgi:DNA-binding CsgD family transcriptional regulator/chromosome segregation and condensation protein ScpB